MKKHYDISKKQITRGVFPLIKTNKSMKHIFTLLLSIASLTSFSQNWDEMIKASASDRGTEDLFGYTISIDGDRAAISSIFEDEDVLGGNTLNDAGSVYIFELSDGVWSETAKLVASDRDTVDRFGHRISLSGDRILIGASLEDEDASGANTLSEAGSAYIFDLVGGVWTETVKLVASDRAADDRFGFDVSLSGDRAIIGAYLNDTDASGVNSMGSAGAAYVFDLVGGVWTETEKLVASDRASGNLFGLSLSMIGSTVVIGAYHNRTDASGANPMTNAGAAYVFDLVGGVWTETAKLVASDREAGDRFGHNLEMDGNKAIIGAYNRDEPGAFMSGKAYIFELNGGVWTETAKLLASDISASDNFGYSVDISGDRAIVGARNEDQDVSGANQLSNSGSAYIFELNGGVWSETTKLVASDRDVDDQFGISVAISGDMVMIGGHKEDEDASGGNTLVDAGSIYIFNTCNDNQNVTVSGNVLTAQTTGAIYQWLDCDNGNVVISSATNQSYTATVNGNYSVSVTMGGCVDTSACTSITTVRVGELELENELNIYPNPTKGMMEISLPDFENTVLTVYDVVGQEIARQKMVSSLTLVDLTNNEKGIYFVRLTSEKGSVVKRLVRQ